MPFRAGDTVGIETAAGMSVAGSRHGSHVLAEIQSVVVIALAFVVLRNQLQLAVVIKLNRPGTHQIQAIGMLQTGLGIIEH